MDNKFLSNNLNGLDLMNRNNLLNFIKNGVKPGTESLIFKVISANLVNLSNESSLKDYEDLMKTIDFKSKVFINDTKIDNIPMVGDLYKFLGIKGELNTKTGNHDSMRGWIHRACIELLYHFSTIIILQRLINKIIYLNAEKPGSEELTDFNVLLQEYMRKIDPRIRRYLKGSRVNIINKVYTGYDTEFDTKEYSKVNLLSTQLSYTGTIIIRVNNIDKGFDFSKNLLSDGVVVKDYSFDTLLEKVPELQTVTSVITDLIKELRRYMEHSINDDFILQLKSLEQRGLLIKTSETDSVLEFMVPLLEENGVPKFNNEFNFHEAGTENPSFTNIIDTVTDLSTLMIDERYNYFLKLLNKSTINKEHPSFTNIKDTDLSTLITDERNNMEGLIINNEEPILTKSIELINTDSKNELVKKDNKNELVKMDNKYITNSDKVINPFVKDNKHPNELSRPDGVLRGDHRRNTIIILGCHFSIADLSLLSDFDSIKNKFDNVQGTLVTIKQPFLLAKGRTVYLRDTMLLSPAGGTLSDLGVLYNLPKLDVGDYITRMTDLRNDNPILFKEYAIRDAEIALRHIIEMEVASFKITGIGNVPTTLSSLARRFVFKHWADKRIDLSGFINFGKYKIAEFDSLYTPKALQSTGEVGLALPTFLGAFRGGRNESYAYGVNREEIWYDYDLTSAYTTAMSLLGIPDFDSSIHVTKQIALNKFMKRCGLPTSVKDSMEAIKYSSNPIESFKVLPHETTLENSYSAFHIEFEFPDTVIHPSLPISLNDTSSLYPLKGTTIATGFEVFLALSQGCKVKLLRGIIVPYKTQHKPYLDVISYLQEQRRYNKKVGNVLYDLLYKQLGNSIYGQTAQGFNNLRKFNSRSGLLESTGTSPLSNPLIASHISGLTRAVLGEVIRQVEIKGGKIVSCTTDGLITNLGDLLTSLDYDSKLLQIFSNLRNILSGDDSILELKANSEGIISWATRGQLGINALSKKPISAMTGFQPKFLSMKERTDLVENAISNEIYDINFGQQSLRKATDIYKYGGHVTTKITEKVFRVVYDNRRQIIDNGVHPSKDLLFTKPFIDLDTALTIDTISNLGSDLYAPNSNYTNKSGSKDYIDIAVRTFIRALTQGKLNLENPFLSYIEIVKYVKDTFKFDINVNYIASQKRRKFISKIVPNNEQTRFIVEQIKIRFPDFNEKDFFIPLKKVSEK